MASLHKQHSYLGWKNVSYGPDSPETPRKSGSCAMAAALSPIAYCCLAISVWQGDTAVRKQGSPWMACLAFRFSSQPLDAFRKGMQDARVPIS